jgi:hypothetical protein
MTNSDTNRASVKPSPIHQLSIGAAFNRLTEQERHYAHHMSRFVISNLIMFTISLFC